MFDPTHVRHLTHLPSEVLVLLHRLCILDQLVSSLRTLVLYMYLKVLCYYMLIMMRDPVCLIIAFAASFIFTTRQKYP